MLFLSLSRQPVLLLLLFITLKQDPWWAFTVPRLPSRFYMPPCSHRQTSKSFCCTRASENLRGLLMCGVNICCVSNKPQSSYLESRLPFNLYNRKRMHNTCHVACIYICNSGPIGDTGWNILQPVIRLRLILAQTYIKTQQNDIAQSWHP